MAPHSSALTWKIPWTEEPGRLQSMGSLRVGHDWVTSLWFFTFMHWRRKWQPTPVFLPGESQGQGSLGLPSMGSHRVGHDWSDLAAAAAHLIGSQGIFTVTQNSEEDREWNKVILDSKEARFLFKFRIWGWSKMQNPKEQTVSPFFKVENVKKCNRGTITL